MRRGVAFLSGLLCVGTLLVARPHVEERWALYLGSPAAGARAHLFLDPFPTEASCRTRVAVFAANGERAFCSGHRELVLGVASDTVLAADFNPLFPAAWFCVPRTASRRS